MKTNIDHIFIFKSNIKTDMDVYVIKTYLDIHPCIEQWNIDMDEEDRILRIVSSTLNEKNITDLICKCGYSCEALKD